MMRYAILILAVIGFALLYLAKRVSNAPIIDEALASVIPFFLGVIVLGIDVALLLGYALYRLFFT